MKLSKNIERKVRSTKPSKKVSPKIIQGISSPYIKKIGTHKFETQNEVPIFEVWTFIEELLVELWGISGMRENDTFDEMQRKLSAVVNVVKKNIQQKLDTEQWHSTLNSIIDFFGIGNIKAKFPAYKQGTYFMNVINQFESLFFEEYVAAHGVWNLAIENFRGDHSVPIMTIHKSKGLEYNAVYFIGLEDSAFWNFRNQPDEDRCTFFVALSRAKASVTFTFCKKRTGMKCPMQRHNAINEFFDLLQRPGIAEVKRFQNR